MFKKIISFLLLTYLTNCTNSALISSSNFSLDRKSAIIITREKPVFLAVIPKNMSALYPGTKEIGKTIVKENEIADPIDLIIADLSNDIEVKYNGKIVGKKLEESDVYKKLYAKNEKAALEEKELNKISSKYHRRADYALDIRTVKWGFIFLPFDTKKYSIMYHLNLRLIDLNSGKVVLEKTCPADNFSTNHYTYEMLLANKAKLLKVEFKKVANYCSSEFRNAIFDLKNR